MSLANLSEHLHTTECNELVKSYLKCVKEHPVGRFFNHCADQEKAIRVCFKKEKRDKVLRKKHTTVTSWGTGKGDKEF